MSRQNPLILNYFCVGNPYFEYFGSQYMWKNFFEFEGFILYLYVDEKKCSDYFAAIKIAIS